MFIIRHKTIFISTSIFLMAVSLAAVLIFGLNLGIDFSGGSLVEVQYTSARPDINVIKERLNKMDLGDYQLQLAGEDSYILRTPASLKYKRETITEAFSLGGKFQTVEKRSTVIGPVIGEELKRKALAAFLVVFAATIVFVAYAFRKVSNPVSSWIYGVVAVFTLFHDVLIPTGVFVVLGRLQGVEINVLFATAMLAILGFSVNDTIVIFDRIRENLSLNQEKRASEPFDITVGKSLEQTFMRSLNTSLTVILTLIALLIFSSPAVKFFSLALLIGVVAGSYSSLFLASPLLVAINQRLSKK